MYLFKCALLLYVAVAAQGFSLGPADIVFHLFTRNNPAQSQILLPSEASLLTSGFQTSLPTIFTIHSHSDSVAGNFNAFVVRGHLDAENVNVIAVDWSRGGGSYSFALSNIPQVGRVVAQFINILRDNIRYPIAQIRIVGLGLGAHAAGIAGKSMNGNIPRIIALDPSLTGWSHHPEILSKDDAGLVEVLHTTAGEYGYDRPLGDIDFYANGGSRQTGCGEQVSCSHTYAYVFYAESVSAEANNGAKFVGTACESYNEAITLRCTGNRDAIFGGIANKPGANGIYVFLTNLSPPFARG